MNARISQLHKTEAGWAEVQAKYESHNEAFVPRSGELIVYEPDERYEYARLKIGDGETALQDLPFLAEAIFSSLATKTIDAGRI